MGPSGGSSPPSEGWGWECVNRPVICKNRSATSCPAWTRSSAAPCSRLADLPSAWHAGPCPQLRWQLVLGGAALGALPCDSAGRATCYATRGWGPARAHPGGTCGPPKASQDPGGGAVCLSGVSVLGGRTGSRTSHVRGRGGRRPPTCSAGMCQLQRKGGLGEGGVTPSPERRNRPERGDTGQGGRVPCPGGRHPCVRSPHGAQRPRTGGRGQTDASRRPVVGLGPLFLPGHGIPNLRKGPGRKVTRSQCFAQKTKGSLMGAWPGQPLPSAGSLGLVQGEQEAAGGRSPMWPPTRVAEAWG